MSTYPKHRIRSIGLVATTTAVLVGTTGSLAWADPPELNDDPCATELFQAAIWPGTTSDGTRLVSDGFVTHLSRQAPCDSALSRR